MRQACIVGALCVLCQLVAVPADAWYGRLARLSGPGPFNGLQMEVRVACFGPHAVPTTVRDRIVAAEELTRLAELADASTSDARWGAARDAWQIVRRTLGGARDPGARSTARDTAAAEREEVLNYFQVPATRMAMAVGTEWSLCPDGAAQVVRRRASIELGTRVLWSERDPRYAGGERLSLVTLAPAVTWRVFTDPRYDVLDLGVAGGVYWISSPGFPSLSGVFLEPGRVDVHAPGNWRTKTGWDPRRWVAALNLRAAALTFPAGFEADAFAATGDKAVRLPGELVPSVAIYLNINSMLAGVR